MNNNPPLEPEKFLQKILDHPEAPKVFVAGLTRLTPHWSFESRSIQDHVFYFMVEGGIQGRVEGQPFKMSKGSCFWMKPRTTHTFHTDSQYPISDVYHIRINVAPDIDIKHGFLFLHDAHELEGLFKHSYHSLSRNSQRGPRVKTILTQLILAITDHAERFGNKEEKETLNPVAYRKILEAFEREPSRGWTVRDLSKLAGLSLDYFSHLFKGSTGQSPKSWLLEQKLKKASDLLLESTDSISQCADQTGFSDIYHLSRCFKARYGMSPKAWRQRKG